MNYIIFIFLLLIIILILKNNCKSSNIKNLTLQNNDIESKNIIIFDNRIEMIRNLNLENKIIAEIGVFTSKFSDYLLDLNPKKLILIDPYIGKTHSGDQDGNNVEYYDMENLYNVVKNKYINNSKIILYKDFSYSVLPLYSDNYFDAIYIDGDHSYKGCKTDLELCYKKVKNNGLIMGHDFGINSKKTKIKKEFGVIDAVKEFCKKYNQKISYKGMDGCISYGIILKK